MTCTTLFSHSICNVKVKFSWNETVWKTRPVLQTLPFWDSFPPAQYLPHTELISQNGTIFREEIVVRACYHEEGDVVPQWFIFPRRFFPFGGFRSPNVDPLGGSDAERCIHRRHID
jgi:hypothetical protein